jgi:teichuronic acid biosynthesis glycosyltransferase TuaC
VAVRKELGLPIEKKLIIFVGSLIQRKGIDKIISLMEHFGADVQALIVGDGPLRHLVCNSPRCTWIPRVPNSQLVNYLSAADVMVLPAEHEGTPTVLVEAGAAHLPVIANAVNGIPELIGDEHGLLTELNNMDSFVGAVQSALSDPVAAAARAELFYTYIKDYYDAQKNSYKLKLLYEQVIRSFDFNKPCIDPSQTGTVMQDRQESGTACVE